MGKEQLVDLIFEVIAISQSLIMGLFMLILSIRRTKSWSYLGIFLILFSFSTVFDICIELECISEKSGISILSDSLMFILPTAYYRYVYSLLIVPYRKTLRGLLLFGYSFFLLGGIAFLTKIMPLNSPFYSLYEVIGSFYLLFVFITISLQIYRHNRLLKQQYSNLEHRELTWVFYFTILQLFTMFITPFLYSFMPVDLRDFWGNLLFSIISIIWLLGIIYNGFFYQFSKNYLSNNKIIEQHKEKKKEIKIIKKESFTRNEVLEVKNNKQIFNLFEAIKNLLQQKKLYLNTDLTIADIATELNAHPKAASQAINQFSGQNFSSFVNAYRVEYAVELLIDQNYKNISIEGIGNKAGFKSNSVFYTAFKKKMHVTPLQYQKETIKMKTL